MRALHMLYAANRWEVASKLRRVLWDSVIIINRYSPSNLAYGLAHCLPANWLFSLDEGLPKPDLVIILDIPARMSADRKSKHRDVHEADIAYLRRVRREYLRLAEEFGWRIVNGGLDQSAVRESVWRMVAPLIRR